MPTLATYDALRSDAAELGFPKESLAKVNDVALAGRRSLEILKAAGTKIGFGSDLLGAMHRYQSNEFLIRAEVLSPQEILISATSGNAELLNAEGVLGVVAPGAKADLIAVEGDPFKDLALLQKEGAFLPLIMRDGILFKNTIT